MALGAGGGWIMREREDGGFSYAIADTGVHDSGQIVSARAAFGYYGSKQRLARKILNYLPRHYCWVDLCCGSAAVSIAKSPARIEVINDLDGEIVNVFRQLRDRPEELINAIALTPYAREEFQEAMRGPCPEDDLERARRFLVKAMMAVNGVLGKARGGFSHSNTYSRNGKEARVNRWRNYPERLAAVAVRLRDFRIENREAVELLEMFSNRPGTLIYVDPPYLTRRKAGYTVDMEDEEFHLDLLRQANVSRCMIVISGYRSELYEALLSESDGWTTVSLGASTKTTSGATRPRVERLWINSLATGARKRNRIPVRLSKRERADGKVNPARGPRRRP